MISFDGKEFNSALQILAYLLAEYKEMKDFDPTVLTEKELHDIIKVLEEDVPVEAMADFLYESTYQAVSQSETQKEIAQKLLNSPETGIDEKALLAMVLDSL